MEPVAKKPRVMGPCVWWVRNDLRIQDNPALRAVNGAALVDDRKFVAVYCFDRRSLDHASHGYSITNFSGKNTKALHARFVLQSVLALRDELAAAGSKLLVCSGNPEEILPGLPTGSEVKCQSDPMSHKDLECCQYVESMLIKTGSKLRRDFGATGLYHWHELPFGPKEKPDWYSGLSGLAKTLGWKDIASSADRQDKAAAVRPVVPAPSAFAKPCMDLQLPGLVPADVLADETKMLQHLGYTTDEIKEAQTHKILQGGEPAARAALEKWAAEKNWAAASADFVNYMMLGCMSAREIFHNATDTPQFHEVAQHLLWRDFHRLHGEPEEKGPQLCKPNSTDEMMLMKEQIKQMSQQIEDLRHVAKSA